jgi:hypothetical protein
VSDAVLKSGSKYVPLMTPPCLPADVGFDPFVTELGGFLAC